MKTWKIISNKKISNPGEIVDVLLSNRGIKNKKEREEFLNSKLEDVSLKSTGIDPASVRKTIRRISAAIKNNEKIIIYGDYDVDGICGTAILWETLFAFYKNVMPYIPRRVEEGYGLSVRGIENIISQPKAGPPLAENVKLIITVDNGIVANEAVEFASKNGIDVIITDHHVKSKKIPRAHSIVHTTKLCGAGVAYLLAKEIARIHNSEFIIYNSLELVVLATVSDLVPLVGANRSFVKFGIESLQKTKRPGLLALFAEAQIRKEEIDVYKIGHIIAPRLNASGRIAHAMDSLRLLCTRDSNRAKNLALELSETNKTRQILTEESTLYADSVTEVSEKIIFAHDAKYNQGVIGLVASRLVEKHYKPSIVIAVGEKISKGSARSIKGFNIIEFLRTFSSHLIDAGGHPMAAGFTMESSRIKEFKTALLEASAKLISGELLERVLKIDLEVSFIQVNPDLYSAIQKLAPFGMGNPDPLFISKKVRVETIRLVGRENKHVKLALSQKGKVFDGIFFGGGEQGLKAGDGVNIAYTIEQDSWNGRERIQLKIKDIIAEGQDLSARL